MSVSRRFWFLVGVVLCATILCSAGAIWFTSTPFLEANQAKVIQDQAEKEARAFDNELAQYQQLLQFVAAQENVVSVVIGYVENADVVSNYFETLPRPDGLISVTLLDALQEVTAHATLQGVPKEAVRSPEWIAAFEETIKAENRYAPAVVKLIPDTQAPYLLMAVPVFNRGFAEGVLVAEVDIDFDAVFTANNVTRRSFVAAADPGFVAEQEALGHWVESVAHDQLSLVSIPDVEATASVGRMLLFNVMTAISATLLVSFSIFAWLFRR